MISTIIYQNSVLIFLPICQRFAANPRLTTSGAQFMEKSRAIRRLQHVTNPLQTGAKPVQSSPEVLVHVLGTTT